jgi:8-oxo-dGTP pyrophosphatase MutT (NUDIX family)
MWVDETVLEPVREAYGTPRVLELQVPISVAERDLVRHSTRKGRHHDVTFFVFHGDRLALIRKPHYAPGLWRPPGGGLKPGEPFEAGVRREAREELGVDIDLTRYLVRTKAVFTHENVSIPWETHVFAASTETYELDPLDTEEISAARWGTLDELSGPVRRRLLETGRALWAYRVELHDAAAAALAGT